MPIRLFNRANHATLIVSRGFPLNEIKPSRSSSDLCLLNSQNARAYKQFFRFGKYTVRIVRQNQHDRPKKLDAEAGASMKVDQKSGSKIRNLLTGVIFCQQFFCVPQCPEKEKSYQLHSCLFEGKSVESGRQNGDPGAIRTRDVPLRRRTLYPAEVRDHALESPYFSRLPRIQ